MEYYIAMKNNGSINIYQPVWPTNVKPKKQVAEYITNKLTSSESSRNKLYCLGIYTYVIYSKKIIVVIKYDVMIVFASEGF